VLQTNHSLGRFFSFIFLLKGVYDDLSGQESITALHINDLLKPHLVRIFIIAEYGALCVKLCHGSLYSNRRDHLTFGTVILLIHFYLYHFVTYTSYMILIFSPLTVVSSSVLLSVFMKVDVSYSTSFTCVTFSTLFNTASPAAPQIPLCR
jgi:hypothetical protein